jgi:hypothetical protein
MFFVFLVVYSIIPYFVFLLTQLGCNNLHLKTNISNLVGTTRFWNNFHQVAHKMYYSRLYFLINVTKQQLKLTSIERQLLSLLKSHIFDRDAIMLLF